MRVSTSQVYSDATFIINRQQNKLYKTQQQIASGKAIAKPSDDPIRVPSLILLKQKVAELNQYQENGQAARGLLSQSQGAMNAMLSVLDDTNDLLIQANSGILNYNDKQNLKAEVTKLLEEFVHLANTTDASGKYIYSGALSENKAISLQGNSFVYNGDDTNRQLQISSSGFATVNETGFELFMTLKTGNGQFEAVAADDNQGTGIISSGFVSDLAEYNANEDNFTVQFTVGNQYQIINNTTGTPVISNVPYKEGEEITVEGMTFNIKGQPQTGDSFDINISTASLSTFEIYQNFIDALDIQTGSDEKSNATFQNNVTQLLSSVNVASNRISNYMAVSGTTMTAIDRAEVINQASELSTMVNISRIEDTDLESAAIALNLQSVALQAAQQSFISINDLFLFNFL